MCIKTMSRRQGERLRVKGRRQLGERDRTECIHRQGIELDRTDGVARYVGCLVLHGIAKFRVVVCLIDSGNGGNCLYKCCDRK